MYRYIPTQLRVSQTNHRDNQAFQVCPVCSESIDLHDRKDFESHTGSEMYDHLATQHPDWLAKETERCSKPPDWKTAMNKVIATDEPPYMDVGRRQDLPHHCDGEWDENEEDRDIAVEAAIFAFWAKIAEAYPQATSGDLPPIAIRSFDKACRTAVDTWLRLNLPSASPFKEESA